MRLQEFKGLNAALLCILLHLAIQGAHCGLLVSPAAPTLVNAVAGTNVTLAVSFSGASNPVVTWYMAGLPVGTLTINSSSPADIAEGRRDVLRIEQNGSLTFVHVPLDYSSNYTFEITKSGLDKAATTFMLRVFEIIQNVTLSTEPDFAVEGSESFTLLYSMLQGVVQQQVWSFNDKRIQSDSHYLVKNKSLSILRPTRSDTGQYSVVLTNPFSSVTTHTNVTVFYGPDEPSLEVHPARPFYVRGDSLSLSCTADGLPTPTVRWVFGDQNISETGVLNLTDVQTSQGGVYTCLLLNMKTKHQKQRSLNVTVHERPSGSPSCSVLSLNSTSLQYQCLWSGGVPQAKLYFPALSSSSGAGNFSLDITASENLNGKTVTCMAEHPTEMTECKVTAYSPVTFQPAVRTTNISEAKITVTVLCVSEASPSPVVSWLKGSQAVSSGTVHQVSSDTTQLHIRHFNLSNIQQENYTCTSRNPLGSQRRDIQLTGPSISNFSVVPNQDGTSVRLTWKVPHTSVVTGFDIQMKGPDLLSKHPNETQKTSRSNRFRTIKHEPDSARLADIFYLDPKSTYRFRVVPKALQTEGKPSEVHRVGAGLAFKKKKFLSITGSVMVPQISHVYPGDVTPGEGLSGPAIAGIAAGIPCSLLFLILLAGLIYLGVHCHENRSRQTRYPVSRAVEKAITTQTDSVPHNLLTGGLKSPPDYNRLQLTPSEKSVPLPSFVPPPPPVRVATVV